jgi:hypothetical protein
MLTMPVTHLQCISFSPDGRFLACVGKTFTVREDKKTKVKTTFWKETIIVWDISRIHKGEKAEILAK